MTIPSTYDVIRWILSADSDQVRLLQTLLGFQEYELRGGPRPSIQQAIAGAKVVVPVRSPVTKRVYKAKKTKETMDAAAILANKKGPRTKGNTNAETPDVYRGLKGKVYEALRQTTGKLTSTDLAEILEVKPTQKVSEVLSQGFKTGSIKGLFREPGKTTLPGGKVVPAYLYWLDGGLK